MTFIKSLWTRILIGFCAVFAGAGMTVSAETPSMTARLVPDWELGPSVALVWPEYVPGQRGKVTEYVELIRSLPSSAEVALVSSEPPRVRWLQEMGREVRYLALPGVRDLRIGDWGHCRRLILTAACSVRCLLHRRWILKSAAEFAQVIWRGGVPHSAIWCTVMASRLI